MLPFALTVDAWYPVTAPYTNGSDARSREALQKVVDQFEVERNPRYKPAVNKNNPVTFCNIYVSDLTTALSATIPAWWLGKEQTANEMIGWLEGAQGNAHGWKKELSPENARVAALAGRVVVATWKNPVSSRPGHMAIVLPDSSDLLISQAGKDNFARARIAVGFGDRPVVYWVHA